MSQSKLSEALALTLMRYKEIDRDTIEALCKRAAVLESQVDSNSGREHSLRRANNELRSISSALFLVPDKSAGLAIRAIDQLHFDLAQARERFAERAEAERDLSDAYIRLRSILGALNAGEAPTAEQVWAHTEAKAQALLKSHTQLQWALRDLVAQTRDLHDCGPEDESYQSESLRNAIDTADALVGADVTDQIPIADESLNRRIQELEVALAAEQKKKQGQVFISEAFIPAGSIGERPRVQVGRVQSEERKMEDATGVGITTAGVRTGFLAQAAEKTSSAVHEALREALREGLVPRTVFFNPAAELKPKMQPRRWSEQSLRALIRDVVSDTQTVDVPADFELHTVVTINGPVQATNKLVKEIIAQEMRPGGRIHSALIKR